MCIHLLRGIYLLVRVAQEQLGKRHKLNRRCLVPGRLNCTNDRDRFSSILVYAFEEAYVPLRERPLERLEVGPVGVIEHWDSPDMEVV